MSSVFQSLPKDSSVEVMVHPMYGTLESLDITNRLTDSGGSIAEQLKFWQEHAGEVEFVK